MAARPGPRRGPSAASSSLWLPQLSKSDSPPAPVQTSGACKHTAPLGLQGGHSRKHKGYASASVARRSSLRRPAPPSRSFLLLHEVQRPPQTAVANTCPALGRRAGGRRVARCRRRCGVRRPTRRHTSKCHGVSRSRAPCFRPCRPSASVSASASAWAAG
jgi:hypothetical protein